VTIIPFLIVILLLVMTLSAMNRADPPPAPSPDLVVTGHQFCGRWITRLRTNYSKRNPYSHRQTFVSALGVKDVLHEFWVPELTRKMKQCAGPT